MTISTFPFPGLAAELESLSKWAADEVVETFVREKYPDEQATLLDVLRAPRYAVSLYGPTKAGKTTLILKLLGVDEIEVGHILRGNPDADKTGTPTAIRYTRSPDERIWYVTGADGARKPLDSDAKAKLWLEKVREDMQDRGITGERCLKIEIPGRHFTGKSAFGGEAKPVDLIDLPGHSGGESNERAHAGHLYEMIARRSAMVLHVYPAQRIISAGKGAGLKSGSELLDNWWNYADRSKLVLTHAIGQQTCRELIEPLVAQNTGTNDLGDGLRRHCWEQLREELPYLDETMIVPLEYGTSWEGLKNTYPGYADAMETVRVRFLEELAIDILKSNPPKELFGAVSHAAAKRFFERKIVELQKRLSEKKVELETAEGLVQEAQESHNEALTKRRELNARRDAVESLRRWDTRSIKTGYGKFDDGETPHGLTGHVDHWKRAIKESLSEALDELKCALNPYANTLDPVGIAGDFSKSVAQSRWQALDPRPEEDTGILSTIGTWFAGDARDVWARKRGNAEKCCEDILNSAVVRYNDAYDKHRPKALKKLEDKLAEAEEFKSRTLADLKGRKTDVEKLTEEIENIRKNILTTRRRRTKTDELDAGFKRFSASLIEKRLRDYETLMRSPEVYGNIGRLLEIKAVHHHLKESLPD